MEAWWTCCLLWLRWAMLCGQQNPQQEHVVNSDQSKVGRTSGFWNHPDTIRRGIRNKFGYPRNECVPSIKVLSSFHDTIPRDHPSRQTSASFVPPCTVGSVGAIQTIIWISTCGPLIRYPHQLGHSLYVTNFEWLFHYKLIFGNLLTSIGFR